jgi:predicted DCC family thiol-disulfide oxidoreductase YuxK
MKKTKTILFDGDCSFCNFWVKFITKRDPKKQFEFVSLQSEKGMMLLDKYKVSKEVDSIVFIKNNKSHVKSRAVLRIAWHLKLPYPLAIIFMVIPWFMRDWLYDLVAKNRHKIFNQDNSCEIPFD